MATMRYLDLSYEGRQVAERSQLDNGKLPHGAYRGTRKHPPSHLSYDKGREFKDRLDAEVSRIIEQDDLHLQGESPSWALLLNKEPSYTDESSLFVQKFMDASKHSKFNVSVPNRQSLLPKANQPLKYNGTTYYRPNRMHQYLTATELKNAADDDKDVKLYGRPTRTTLLRARKRSTSASTNSYDQRREFYQRVDDIKSNSAIAPSTEYLQLRSLREGESLHSYLTGARYNRAHCLDSKSVDHSGVYMPRQNPAYGMFFRGPKGQEYLQEFEAVATARSVICTPPNSARRRPVTAPTAYHRRPVTAQRPSPQAEVKATRKTHARSTNGDINRAKEPKLNVVGCGLHLGAGKDLLVRLSRRPETARASLDRRGPLEETYRVNQPPPTPTDGQKTSLVSELVSTVDAPGPDVRGEVTDDNRDEEKENRVTARVDLPNDARGDVQESLGAETEDKEKETEDEKSEEISKEEGVEEKAADQEREIQDEKLQEVVAEEKTVSEENYDVPVEADQVEDQEQLGEAEHAQEKAADDVLEEQAKELVEEVVEKAEEEIAETAQEGENEEVATEEVEGEVEESVDEEDSNKAVKEVRFFITEQGEGPKEVTEVVDPKDEDDES